MLNNARAGEPVRHRSVCPNVLDHPRVAADHASRNDVAFAEDALRAPWPRIANDPVGKEPIIPIVSLQLGGYFNKRLRSALQGRRQAQNHKWSNNQGSDCASAHRLMKHLISSERSQR